MEARKSCDCSETEALTTQPLGAWSQCFRPMTEPERRPASGDDRVCFKAVVCVLFTRVAAASPAGDGLLAANRAPVPPRLAARTGVRERLHRHLLPGLTQHVAADRRNRRCAGQDGTALPASRVHLGLTSRLPSSVHQLRATQRLNRNRRGSVRRQRARSRANEPDPSGRRRY